MISNKDMAKATLSNYIILILRIIVSLFLVRIMYLGMGAENYGFWALLWSIFGYSVLLEFGLGVTIQKKSSDILHSGEFSKFSNLMSTYIATYFIISTLIIITSIVLSINLESLFVFTDLSKIDDFKLAILIFGIGTAITFSFGFIAEILKGLHLIHKRNVINIWFILLNGGLLWLCVELSQPIYIFALVATVVQALNNLAFILLIRKEIPDIRFSFKLIDFSDVKRSMKFSLSAYVIMFSNMLIFRTDQIIISSIAGVAFAGFYQISARVSELFRQLSTQFHESLSTKSIIIKDQAELSNLLINSNRLITVISTMFFVPLFILIEPLLFYWLDLTNPDTVLAAKILLVSMYVLVVFRSSMVSILLMNDLHLELMKIAVFEAIFNIALSIYLVSIYGLVGAAIGTLIPNIILTVIYNIPRTIEFSNIKFKHYIFSYFFPSVIILIISFTFGFILKLYFLSGFISLVLIGVIMPIFTFILFDKVYYHSIFIKKIYFLSKNVLKYEKKEN